RTGTTIAIPIQIHQFTMVYRVNGGIGMLSTNKLWIIGYPANVAANAQVVGTHSFGCMTSAFSIVNVANWSMIHISPAQTTSVTTIVMSIVAWSVDGFQHRAAAINISRMAATIPIIMPATVTTPSG